MADVQNYPKNMFDLITSLKSMDGRDVEGKDVYDEILDDFEELDEEERIPLYLKKGLSKKVAAQGMHSDVKRKHGEVKKDLVDEEEEEDFEMIDTKAKKEDEEEDLEDDDDDLVEDDDEIQDEEEYYVEEDEAGKDDANQDAGEDEDESDDDVSHHSAISSNLGKRKVAPENGLQKNFSPNVRVNSGNGSL